MLQQNQIEERVGNLLNDVIKVNRNYAVDNNAAVQECKRQLKNAMNKAYFSDSECQTDNKRITALLLDMWLEGNDNAADIKANISRYVFDEAGFSKRGEIREGTPCRFEPAIIDSVATALQWVRWCADVRASFSAKIRKARQSTAEKAQRYIEAARSYRSLSKTIALVCKRKGLNESEMRSYYASKIKQERDVHAAMLSAKKRKG